ncbi:bifunctional folylpolyglutamate synthase/dihydrofolate synthase [Phytoactinopolyspora halotolerans]|uniref:Dihydrofolate synthase/folylpolyglutamate synthase n=1 Tax=Phytoactinopolyspora halotolerans TaxID=1981512 RepID=A0A6L9SCH5_9ACTN|nr:folylpolyglutamate synthase/dihydrofolate synthase family protein [Phytoactinopolyspora halotolerans]NEE02773.1 bifunctional folylpolyglutamate synthase/dihydrofolate synthase [Phytoactinopolyspora halotolerans]
MSKPDFEAVQQALRTRWPESKLEPSLDRIRDLLDVLGNPQQVFSTIHVAGTNGKTSTARMVDELLRELNLRTGRFTSPHLVSVTERIVVDGEPISEERFAEVYAEVEPFLGIVDAKQDVPLSFFEVLVAMAYAAFADAPVEVAVIEVGMGGTWDATNVADGKVSVVTPISLDHMDYLGDSMEAIAGEKAGVIKPGSFTLLAGQEQEAAEVLLTRVGEVGATVARAGVEFGVRDREMAVGGQMLQLQGLTGPYDDVFLPLHGAHQADNAALALAAVEAFVGGGREGLAVEAVQAAFARVSSPGRLEVLRRGPVVLVDAAHNPAGASALAASLSEEFATTALVAVVAVLEDKDVEGILAALEPVVQSVVVTSNSSPRCLPPQAVARVAVDVFGEDRVHQASPLPEAVDVGLTLAERAGSLGGHGVVITGSVVTAGDARASFGVES